MARRRKRSLVTELAAVSIASPVVIAERMYRLSQPGALDSRRGQLEAMRMCSEKMAATMESASAMMLEAFAMQQRMWWSAWAGGWPGAARKRAGKAADPWALMMGLAATGIAPYRRRAVSNRRRLSRHL